MHAALDLTLTKIIEHDLSLPRTKYQSVYKENDKMITAINYKLLESAPFI